MAFDIKQELKESDKGSYYNQEGFFVDYDDTAESCETDSFFSFQNPHCCL